MINKISVVITGAIKNFRYLYQTCFICTEFAVEADTVVFAIGLKPEKKLLEQEGVKLNDWGMIEIDD